MVYVIGNGYQRNVSGMETIIFEVTPVFLDLFCKLDYFFIENAPSSFERNQSELIIPGTERIMFFWWCFVPLHNSQFECTNGRKRGPYKTPPNPLSQRSLMSG